MPANSIEFHNISKQYRLGSIGTGTLQHDINRWWHLVRGKEDPYLKVGEVNDRSTKATSDYIWALKDITFNVQEGEVMGIIGKNGAGKSTLLKILSRVTSPTTGVIKAKGRIASLLEVGTGFHPDLTGRENVYMNGAIMGMTRKEITAKLDEIVAFSGVERYIDTPVKRYSSGMTVRLGFAVAAHLEPEILVVDEVLAVGDVEFQKKAIGKMKDVSQGGGRTVLFVSHNMTAVKNLCNSGILLKNGLVDYSGNIDSVVDRYILDQTATQEKNYWDEDNAPGKNGIKVNSAFVEYNLDKINVDDSFKIICEFTATKSQPVHVNLFLYDLNELCIFSLPTNVVNTNLENKYQLTFNIPGNLLNDGTYKVNFMYVSTNTPLFVHENALSFDIHENRDAGGYYGKWIGVVRPTNVVRELKKI